MTKLEIAKAARKVVEAQAPKWDFPPDLMGLCAISSCALAMLFRLFGHEATFIHGYYQRKGRSYEGCHCWVEDSEGMIWDITATQFGKSYPKVRVQPKRGLRAYRPNQVVTEDNLLDVFKGWDNQFPDETATKPIIEKTLQKLGVPA